jgi:uncharacterized protein YdcH (DUF465 family)
MTHVPHELATEFPDKAQLIHELKASDRHFARLVEEYHQVNRQVHRFETRVEAVSEEAEHAARRERVRLKDEIAQMLTAAEAG